MLKRSIRLRLKKKPILWRYNFDGVRRPPVRKVLTGAPLVFMFFNFKRKKICDNVSEIARASGLRHIAFIMDGNGRWATNKGLPREAGHSAGAKNFRTVVRYCKSIGIEYITAYAFSTENWKRPKREVDAIMRLLDTYIDEAREEDDVEYIFIGDRGRIEVPLAERMDMLESMTKGRKYRLNIAINYGGRDEIVHAVNRAVQNGKTHIEASDIDAGLYTSACPDPDLVVRTGDEYRISNFLLWQSAYSELYFSPKLWPDFGIRDVDAAVLDFSGRKRRFGGLDREKNTDGRK